MSLDEIQTAVRNGLTVHWASMAYRVIVDSKGKWLIYCDLNADCIGLTWRDGVTLNGKPEQFFIARASHA